MKFVQIIDFETDRMEEMGKFAEAQQQRTGSGPTNRLVLKDRNQPNRYLVVIEFDSYEEAMRNSNDPETTKFAEQMASLCTRPPSFTDYDVLDMTEST